MTILNIDESYNLFYTWLVSSVSSVSPMIYTLWCHTGDCGRLIDTNEMGSAAKLGWAAAVVVLLLVVAMVVFFVIRTIRRTPDDAADQAEQAEDSASEGPARGPSS